jgi:hypothetical protein
MSCLSVAVTYKYLDWFHKALHVFSPRFKSKSVSLLEHYLSQRFEGAFYIVHNLLT